MLAKRMVGPMREWTVEGPAGLTMAGEVVACVPVRGLAGAMSLVLGPVVSG